MEKDQILKFLLTPTDVHGALIKCICLLCFFQHCKINSPFSFILLNQYINDHFKNITLSVCLGLTPIQSYIVSKFLDLPASTINKSNTLFNWTNQFKK